MKKLILFALLSISSLYGQKVASSFSPPTSSLIARGPTGNWLYVDTDSSGNLTSGSPSVLAALVASTGVPPPSALIGLAPNGTWLYVNVDANGNLSTTGAGSGITGLTSGYIPLAGSSTTLTSNSHLDDGITAAGYMNSSEPIRVNRTSNAANAFFCVGSGGCDYLLGELAGDSNFYLYDTVTSNPVIQLQQGAPAYSWQFLNNGDAKFNHAVIGATLDTITNCSSSASPAVCGSAAAGSVALPTNVTASSVVVNTTAVTANSQIFAFADDTLGTKLGITCNSTVATLVGGLAISARTAGTSFTIANNVAVVTNPLCVSYLVIN